MNDKTWQADNLWRDGRWHPTAQWKTDPRGRVLEPGAGTADDVEGAGRWVLPGMVNVHSHAFQRAMAGRVERRQAEHDSFWSWRELMYAFAARIGPDDMRALARQVYVEMLKAGYTRVCEFHYVHHQPDGKPYADSAAMSRALVEAAGDVGIGLTLLPVLYLRGGFDDRPLQPRQQRFGNEVDGFLRLLETLRGIKAPGLELGIALHSQRAVPADALKAVLGSGLVDDCPIHIHIAEQPAEVDDCIERHGARPVEWLLAHADVDPRWCLVHATHVTPKEVQGMAQTGATVGLCPTTEANLGDGLFPLADYLGQGGAIAIGSDSNVSISPVEELRWLEYGQRLTTGKRHVGAIRHASVGESLWQAALEGGSRAAGQPQPLTVGASADLVVLDDSSPLLAGQDSDSMLDGFVFAGNTPLVRDVMVAGQWRVRDFRHADEARFADDYRDVMQALLRD